MEATQESTKDRATVLRECIALSLSLEVEAVPLDANLMDDLGADSLTFLDIVFRLEQAFDIQLTRGEMERAAKGDMSDEEFRKQVTFFGTTQSLGGFFVNTILAGHAAYRTQIFCYLKSCGRTELGTMNLWAGIDAPAS